MNNSVYKLAISIKQDNTMNNKNLQEYRLINLHHIVNEILPGHALRVTRGPQARLGTAWSERFGESNGNNERA